MLVRPEQIAEIGKRHLQLAKLRLVVVRDGETDAMTLIPEGATPVRLLAREAPAAPNQIDAVSHDADILVQGRHPSPGNLRQTPTSAMAPRWFNRAKPSQTPVAGAPDRRIVCGRRYKCARLTGLFAVAMAIHSLFEWRQDDPSDLADKLCEIVLRENVEDGYLQMTESEAVHTFQTNFPKYRRLLFAIEETPLTIAMELSGLFVTKQNYLIGTTLVVVSGIILKGMKAVVQECV